MFLRSLLLSSFLSTAFSAICPPNSFYQEGGCYFAVTTPNTFDNANTFCTRKGGNMASVHNAFENTYLVQMGQSMGSYFWIGLYRVGNGNWTWSDNTTVTYTNWDPLNVFTGTLFQGCAIKDANGFWE